MEIRTEPITDRSRALAEIASELNVPIDYVDQVFQRELSRLTARARVRQFIQTLAMRNTRHFLRGLRMSRRGK